MILFWMAVIVGAIWALYYRLRKQIKDEEQYMQELEDLQEFEKEVRDDYYKDKD